MKRNNKLKNSKANMAVILLLPILIFACIFLVYNTFITYGQIGEALKDEDYGNFKNVSVEKVDNNTVEIYYEIVELDYVDINIYYNRTSGKEPNTYVGTIPHDSNAGVFDIPDVNKNTKIRLENSVNEITINISDSEVEDDNSDANDNQSSVEDSSNTRLERPFGENILNTTE